MTVKKTKKNAQIQYFVLRRSSAAEQTWDILFSPAKKFI
jgi:hypothetical protein